MKHPTMLSQFLVTSSITNMKFLVTTKSEFLRVKKSSFIKANETDNKET